MGADTGLHADKAGREISSRASSWRRESFWCRTMAPRLLKPTKWKVFLPMSIPRMTTVSLDWSGRAVLHTVATVLSSGPAAAQKTGGTLRFFSPKNPPSASIDEELHFGQRDRLPLTWHARPISTGQFRDGVVKKTGGEWSPPSFS